MPELSRLLSPLALGPVELPNRIVSTAHQTTLVHDHLPTDDFVAYHEARAAGGTGLIVLEATAVHESGRLTPHTLAGYREEIVPGYRRTAEAVQRNGTRLFVQLFHGGRELIAAPPRPAAVAPSAVPSQRFHVEPRALEAEEIESLLDGYARSARLAAEGGLDGVELSAAHGYLFAQFFTPGLNLREDQWSLGPAFLLDAVRRVRDAVPALALGVRLSGDSEAAASVAPELAGLVDYVSVTLGDSSTYRGSTGIVPPPPVAENAIAERTAAFRVGPPLLATARIVDPAAAEELIAAGRVDAVGMTRALITDPDLPRKAAAGRVEDVLRCIGCNVCIAHYHAGIPIVCAQNPRTGRERTLPPAERAARKLRIAVVGGGPAGLAAAAEALAAGHDVTLLERERRLGGQIALAGSAPGHAELARSLLRNYEHLLAGADVRLGEDAGEAPAADAVVLATGARPYEPSFPLTGVEVLQAWDVLRGSHPHGRRIVVADWGGDAAGLDCAELLDQAGNDVTLTLGSAAFGETLHQYQRNLYAARFYRAGIRIEHHLELAGASDGSVLFRNLFAPEVERALPADLLVLSLGRVPARLEISHPLVEEAGDCLSPRSLEEAILEGTLAARRAAQRALAGSAVV
ncbi:MAG TPA: FAD-dependent oxidoreductase [Gaiellaceae bacterium]|nr:FAD-dependent oxidoreductase [Gaiellaceae bacterium]